VTGQSTEAADVAAAERLLSPAANWHYRPRPAIQLSEQCSLERSVEGRTRLQARLNRRLVAPAGFFGRRRLHL